MKPVSSEFIKFLIVDDTPENLVALEALLRRPGLEILKARSGSEALELLLVHDVALAILDVQMPTMDGFELAELMRGTERTKHVPIIFVTAGANDPVRMFKGYESGAVDFLFKPIDPHVIKSKAGVFFDLYEQRRALANSLHLNEMFVAILGHDLRSPLSTITSGAKLLEAQFNDEEHRRLLPRMLRATTRMDGMLRQMLDLTRARLGSGIVGNLVAVDVASLVGQAVEEVMLGHPGREISVQHHGDGHALGDPERLLQVFSNLLVNALAHGSAAAPVKVTSVGSDRAVVVSVWNAGSIPPGILPILFEPFRGRSAWSRSTGLGLGLYISHQIMLGHGGSLEVTSSDDEGTAFTACLPRA